MNRSRFSFKWLLGIFTVMIIFGWFGKVGWLVSPAQEVARLDQNVNQVLRTHGVLENFLLHKESHQKVIKGKRLTAIKKEYIVGIEFPLNQFPSLFPKLTRRTSLRILKNEWTRGPSQSEFNFIVGWKGENIYSIKILQRVSMAKVPQTLMPLLIQEASKVAIVLDDWGYNLNNLPRLQKIDIPMTLSVLPHLRFSAQIADSLVGRNYEIILHMPMEAHNGTIRAEKKTLVTSMNDQEIQHTLKEAISSLPHVKGISNHMGSKATEDPRLMRIVMEELQKEELYFLDSLVTPQSVANEVSQQLGIPFAKRNVFLDNHLETEYIKGQILKMVEQAKKNGSAIGIGHDRAVTLQAIQDMVPQLKEQGIQFVYVSQLANKKQSTDHRP